MDKRKYASADGKRGDNQGYRVKSYRHRECAILGAQSKFVKETMNCQGFEHIDQARTVDCPEGYCCTTVVNYPAFSASIYVAANPLRRD